MTFRKPINFSRDIMNKRKEFLNDKKLFKFERNALDSPVESKSPSNGLSGLLILFLFDGECFKAAT